MNRLTDNAWFGLALYSPHIDEQDVTDWICASLIEPSGVVGGVRLAQLAVTSTKSDRQGKTRHVDEKTLTEVLKLSMQGRVHLVSGHDVDIDPYASLTGRDILYLWLTVTRVYASETRELIVEGPKSLYRQADLLSYARQLVCRFGVDYGSIVAGMTRFHVHAMTVFTHSSHVEEYAASPRSGPNHPRKQFAREISYYQSKRYDFGQHIPRASWGNILSPTHIKALGGEERICRESGAYLVERWGENLYLQLTESLWDCTNEDLARLDTFLAPARFPNAPNTVYLNRSSNAYTIY